MKLPKVSIVVVNFNGKKYLKKCFDSIFKLSYPKNLLEVIMVDNVSEDNSVEFVRKNFPKINIVYNNINNYCKANNLGIMKSKADFIAFVNNDTWVNKDWLMELVKVIVQDKKIGCVGSKILLPNGRINSVGHQEFPNFYWGDLGLRKVDSGSFDKLREVKSLCGCSLLIRRPCLNEIGFFDEDFMMYLEDIDISLRCQKAGWKQIFVPRSIIYHTFHGSSNRDFVRFQVERNRLLLIAKHFPEKLGEALFGKGYFLDGHTDFDIFDVLPLALSKLNNEHDRATINYNLPDIFKELKKIINFRNENLSNLAELSHKLNLTNEQLRHKNFLVNDISNQKDELHEQLKVASNDLILKKKEIEKISEDSNRKSKDIAILEKEAEEKNDRFIYGDGFNVKSILIIKPQRVGVKWVEVTLRNFKEKFPGAKFSIVANLLKEDYQLLKINKDINKKLFFSPNTPGSRKFSLFEIFKLILKFNLLKVDLVVIPTDFIGYSGYKKARLLANLIRAKKKIYYDPKENIQRISYSSSDKEHKQFRKLNGNNIPLSLGIFKAESKQAYIKNSNNYLLKVVNVSKKGEVGYLILRVYSASEDGRFEKQRAFFNKRIFVKSESSCAISINYDWQNAPLFFVDGSRPMADKNWSGSLSTKKLYALEMNLCDISYTVVDKLVIFQELI